MTDRANLLHVPQHRTIAATDYEFRGLDGDKPVLEGYASVFEQGYDIMGGPTRGGFVEIVDRRAFDTTLSKNPDVMLLVNHEGGPLARTKSGTMELSTDRRGLRVTATLDPSDPDSARVIPKLRRGDMDEMSFAFRTDRDEWNADDTERRLLEVNLNYGDVSVVNYGASHATSVGLRSLFALGDLDPDEALLELRGLEDPVEALRSAQSTIGTLLRSFVPRMSVADAERIIDRL